MQQKNSRKKKEDGLLHKSVNKTAGPRIFVAIRKLGQTTEDVDNSNPK